MLYAIDRFSDSEYDLIENVCFKYSYFPRFYLEQVQKRSINKFVINSDVGVGNLFNYIAESFSVNDLSYFEIPIDKYRLKNIDKVKDKSKVIYEKYIGG